MANDFLPEGTEIPQPESNYLKLEEGENIVRALSSAITGWEYWTEDKEGKRTPVRVKTYEEVPDGYKNNKDRRQNASYFWAFVIYNAKNQSIQILEIRQKGIMRGIEGLTKSPKWGSPKDYNLIITKTKTGSEDRDVEYSVMPEPKEELDKGILQAYKDMNIDLSALYRGDDPFKAGQDVDPDDVPDNLSE